MATSSVNTKAILWIIGGLVVLAIAAAVFTFSNPPTVINPGDENPGTAAFQEEGIITIHVPGGKPDTWYLTYEKTGANDQKVELDLSSITLPAGSMKNGQVALVAGILENTTVKVSSLEVKNASKDDLIWVSTPLPNQVVASPLTISGQARGNWFFEASFPVKLLDANGKVLAQAPAQATGDWMTTEYVPFTLSLPFTKPTTATGTLVLEKDNPSGLPQNASELRIPVRFDAGQTTVKLYFYNQNNDKDASGNVMCSEKGLVAVTRQIPQTITPIQDAIKLLLQGNPTPAEKAQGISTEFPLAGLTLKSANVTAQGVLTLEFADPQNKTSGGACRTAVLWKQIEATAKQFPGITAVKFIPNTLFQP